MTGLAQDYQYELADTLLTVYGGDAATMIATNNDALFEPGAHRLSRACWIAPATEYVYVKVTWYSTIAPTSTRYAALRVLETTMWSSWFFQGGDYNSFILLRNTMRTRVNFTITWRSAAGIVVGTYSGAVDGNHGIGVNSKTSVADPVTNFSGTVEIAHDGSPDALVGQMTSLSATTGLGFDAPFFQRKPW